MSISMLFSPIITPPLLGDSKFMVESENSKDTFYTCDMLSGYCSCPMGSTCAPCKHKSAVAKHFKIALFSVAPSSDPKMRAMYHFIALGKVLPAHMYRNIGDSHVVPDVENYIENIGDSLKDSITEEDPALLHDVFDDSESDDAAEDVGSDVEEVYDSELVRKRFAEALDEYKTKILDYHVENPQDPSANKAMIAMTKTMKRSMKCLPLTIQNQMHNFGKGTIATNRTKHGGVIKVNSPATSRRTFKVPGRGPAPLGRPLKDRSGKVQMFVGEEDDLLARSDKPFNFKPKKQHNLAKSVQNNETAPKRHTKQ